MYKQSLWAVSSGSLEISGDKASGNNGYLEDEESLDRSRKLTESQKIEEICHRTLEIRLSS